MTETELDKLRERFLDIAEDGEEKKNLEDDLRDEFLKDEMVALLESAGIETKANWTKDELSEKMLSDSFIERVVEDFTPPDDKVRASVKRKKMGLSFFEDMLSPSKLLMNFKSGEYGGIEEFWEDLQKELRSGFGEFKLPPQKYWESVEKEWKEKVRKIQHNINELSETEIPQEEIEELNKLWKDFVKEMSLHLGEIPIELQLRKKKVFGMIQEHTDESKEIISKREKNLKELYPLWFDMVEDIRQELEDTRNYMEDKEEMIYDQWEEFKGEFTTKVEALAVENADKMEKVDKLWSSLSKNFEKSLAKGFEKDHHLHEAFWEELGREKPLMFNRFEKIRKKLQDDYYQMAEQTIESLKQGYEEMTTLEEKDEEKDKEIAELKKRIEELEKKLEEQ